MKQNKKKLCVTDLCTSERIQRAQAKTQKLVDNALHLLALHEANRIIVYSPKLSKQIPLSYAANAFNVFQDASIKFEIVRLCAVLDNCKPYDLDKESIPAVIQLIEDEDVLRTLEEKTKSFWGAVRTREYDQHHDAESKSIIGEAIRASEVAFGQEQGAKTRARLQSAIRWAKRLEASPRLKSVRNMRDKYIAHSLEQSHRDKIENVKKMNYADERHLIWRAVVIVDALHLGINGSNLDWSESLKIARRNALALWHGCQFTPLC